MIPLSKPYLGEEEAAAAREAILSGWVTQGPRVKAFEDQFAAYVGARHACAVSSCTTALHLALLGLGVKPGEVVITVSHSFIATANAVRYCGAEPVFVDIDPTTYNMAPEKLRSCLEQNCTQHGGHLYYQNLDRLITAESPLKYCAKPTGRVAAILAVHQMGIPFDLKKIVPLAKEYNIPLVEDAACAIGSEVLLEGDSCWEKIGKPHGEVACFSFHPRKVLTTGDGGMLTTNNPDLDATFRLLRQHSMSVSDSVRHNSKQVIFEEYVSTGFNYRLTDIQAAVGIEQLKKIDKIISERRNLAKMYATLLGDIKGITLFNEPSWMRINWQSYPVRIDKNSDMQQRELMQYLQNKDIAVRRGIMNAHQEPPYREAGWFLPQSEAARDETILLPFYCGMEEQSMRNIALAIDNSFK